MQRYDRRSIVLAVSLSALAGYIDVLGYLQLGGLFVSFMSGNTTRLAIGLGQGIGHQTLIIALILFMFVLGSFTGTLIGNGAGKSRRTAVLIFVTLCLMFAAIYYQEGYPLIAVTVTVLAMGAENAIFQRGGDVTIGLTYMTGTLVRIGQQLAESFFGGRKTAFLPYLLLWLGMLLGGVMGTLCYLDLHLSALWFAVLFALLLTLFCRRAERHPDYVP